MRLADGRTPTEVLEALTNVDLDDPEAAKKFDAILGNQIWTTYQCGECFKQFERVVFLQQSDHRGICEDCLKSALGLFA